MLFLSAALFAGGAHLLDGIGYLTLKMRLALALLAQKFLRRGKLLVQRTHACVRALLVLAHAAVLLLSKALATLILRPFGIPATALAERVTKQEIRMMVDIGEEKGEIEADEKQMIDNVFEFNNMTAEECMVHRKDVTAIGVDDAAEDILKTIRESGLSRFPRDEKRTPRFDIGHHR